MSEYGEVSAGRILVELLLFAVLSAIGWWFGLVLGVLVIIGLGLADAKPAPLAAVSPLILLGGSFVGAFILSPTQRLERDLGCLTSIVAPLIAWSIWTVVFGSILLPLGVLSSILA